MPPPILLKTQEHLIPVHLHQLKERDCIDLRILGSVSPYCPILQDLVCRGKDYTVRCMKIQPPSNQVWRMCLNVTGGGFRTANSPKREVGV